MTELETYIANYRSTAEVNDTVWTSFGKQTDSIRFLKAHRDWVEENSWGFGDCAFHYLCYLLLRDDVLNRPASELLEIGVYKGQVISLWALIATQLRRPAVITAVSPFQGDKPWFAKIRFLNRAAQLGVSILLCKRPGFGFGDGVPGKGAVPLPWPSDLEAPRAVMRPLSPELACAPATES